MAGSVSSGCNKLGIRECKALVNAESYPLLPDLDGKGQGLRAILGLDLATHALRKRPEVRNLLVVEIRKPGSHPLR